MISGIDQGEHTISIVYSGGEKEEQRVDVDDGSTEYIQFVIEKNDKRNRRLSRYISIGAGCGMVFPFGETETIFEQSIFPITRFYYNIATDWFVFGFGILSGVDFGSTNDGIASYEYDMISVPAGAGVRIRTNFDFPLSFILEADGGAAINIVRYKVDYPGVNNTTFARPFVFCSFGVSDNLIDFLDITIFGGVMSIWLDDSLLTGFIPGIQVEINF
jgi:hypothetical protein